MGDTTDEKWTPPPKHRQEMEFPQQAEEATLAAQLLQAKEEKAAAAAAEKDANKTIAELEEKLYQLMTERGIDLFRTPLGTFSKGHSNHPRVTDPEAFEKWHDENSVGLMKRSVHPSTLKGYVSDLLENGKPLPPGVDNFVQNKINTRRA